MYKAVVRTPRWRRAIRLRTSTAMNDLLRTRFRTQIFVVALCTVSWTPVWTCSSAAGGTVYWNMDDLAAPTSNTVANLTVGPISQGNSTTTGGTATSASSGYSFLLNGTNTAASGSNNLNFSAKSGVLLTASSSYMTVTLTPSAGSTGTVSAIGFGSRSTASGPTTLSLRSSLDSYAVEVTGFSTLTSSTWAYFSNTFSSPLVIASGSSLTLRLYGAGGSTATAGNWRIDDLQLDVVVVPEPAAVVLGMLAVAGVTISVRRSGRWRGRRVTQCSGHRPDLRSSNCSS
jgi:hypothetical protein